MCRVFPIGIGLFLTICGSAWAQTANSRDSTIRYDHSRWKLMKRMSGSFDPLPEPAEVLLLKSLKPTGTGGEISQPMNDVELLIGYGKVILYDYAKEGVKPNDNGTRFYADDYLEIRSVTNDGFPEVLFHSGSKGASDSITIEHILFYDKLGASFFDIALSSFYNSGTHGFRWLNLAGRTFAVIADRNWPPAVALEDRCHYCPSPFEYGVYRWNTEKGSAAFKVFRRLFGKESYEDAFQALSDDWTLIQVGLSR